jgi:hypothetical protein
MRQLLLEDVSPTFYQKMSKPAEQNELGDESFDGHCKAI